MYRVFSIADEGETERKLLKSESRRPRAKC